MRTRNVTVVPYNPDWKEEFLKLKAYLMGALEDSVVAIEHVGSTSVVGLAAKPIIDIDVVMKDYDNFHEVKARLESLGYRHEGDLGIKDREAFKYSDKPEFMPHHLYVCPQYSEELRRHIAFRDYLRTHIEDTEKYSDIKLKAAKLYPTDIDSYMEAKGPVIEEIYRKIGL